jgi:hypothetical protein
MVSWEMLVTNLKLVVGGPHCEIVADGVDNPSRGRKLYEKVFKHIIVSLIELYI